MPVGVCIQPVLQNLLCFEGHCRDGALREPHKIVSLSHYHIHRGMIIHEMLLIIGKIKKSLQFCG